MDACKCGRKMLSPVGLETSKILIVGGHPDPDDYDKLMPFTGKKGNVLWQELARVGIQLHTCRLTYISRHAEVEDCEGQLLDVIHEMKDKQGVLLMGAEASAKFGLGKVSDMAGTLVSSPLFPNSVGFVMVTLLPPTADYLGEFRLSIEKFAIHMKEVKSDQHLYRT